MTRPSLLQIYNEIKSDISSRVLDGKLIPRLSIEGILSVVFAGVTHGQYGYLDLLWKEFLPDQASVRGLKRWGVILKLPRKGATYTSGFVSFTGTASHTVTAGTVFYNSDGKEYETEDSFIIGADDEVSAIALDSGEAYNSDDETMTLSETDPDIDSEVTVVSGFQNGTDEEDLELWRNRLIDRLSNPPHSGCVSDYERWAKEVTGVDRAWCIEAQFWLGASTVAVVASTEDYQPVSGVVLTALEAYIESIRPAPAKVTYLNVSPQDIDLYLKISPNTSSMRTAVRDKLEEYFISASTAGGTLVLWELEQAIAASYPDNYELTKITQNDSMISLDDIILPVPQVAVLDYIYFSSF